MSEQRGGRRQPDNKARPPAGPGKFANRQDLSKPGVPGEAQGAYVPTGLPYGDAQRLAEAQGTAPVPRRRSVPTPATGVPAGDAVTRGGPVDGALVPTLAEVLARPSRYPEEPLTAGLLSGAGPGPEALVAPTEQEGSEIRAMLARASGAGMPPAVRMAAAFYNLLEGAKDSYQQRRAGAPPVGMPTTVDFASEFEDEGAEEFPTVFGELIEPEEGEEVTGGLPEVPYGALPGEGEAEPLADLEPLPTALIEEVDFG